jgi:hypothetical protein
MDRKYSKNDLKVMLAVFTYSGVNEATYESVISELHHCWVNKLDVCHARMSGDALIARSRSRATGAFLNSDCDVMVMIDHDIEWKPGEAWDMAKIAFEMDSIVGGLYCKRALGQGWASRFGIGSDVNLQIGSEGRLVPSDAVATGFMAIPRTALERMVDRLDVHGGYYSMVEDLLVEDGNAKKLRTLADMSVCRIKDGAYKKAKFDYYDMFRCFRIGGADEETEQFMSEDWAFCKRAQFCGIKTYITTKPYLKHHGSYPFRPEDGMDQDDKQKAQECATA